MIEPISPEKVTSKRDDWVRSQVIEIFNRQIIENFDGCESKVHYKSVERLLEEQGFDKTEIWSKRWLDVADDFRKAGWEVEDDKSGREFHPAHWTFRVQ